MFECVNSRCSGAVLVANDHGGPLGKPSIIPSCTVTQEAAEDHSYMVYPAVTSSWAVAASREVCLGETSVWSWGEVLPLVGSQQHSLRGPAQDHAWQS